MLTGGIVVKSGWTVIETSRWPPFQKKKTLTLQLVLPAAGDAPSQWWSHSPLANQVYACLWANYSMWLQWCMFLRCAKCGISQIPTQVECFMFDIHVSDFGFLSVRLPRAAFRYGCGCSDMSFRGNCDRAMRMSLVFWWRFSEGMSLCVDAELKLEAQHHKYLFCRKHRHFVAAAKII